MYLLCNKFKGKNVGPFQDLSTTNQSQDHFLENLGKAVDRYSEKYDNFCCLVILTQWRQISKFAHLLAAMTSKI